MYDAQPNAGALEGALGNIEWLYENVGVGGKKYEAIKNANWDAINAHFAIINEIVEAALVEQGRNTIASFAGKIFVEWRRPNLGGGRLGAYAPTGRRGRLEIVTHETALLTRHPSGMTPDIGDHIMRILKKNGSPSRIYDPCPWTLACQPYPHWHLENRQPNKVPATT